MDIGGISNANHAMQMLLNENERHQQTMDSFRSVLDKAMNDPGAVEKAKIKEACQAFESYFLQIMFREMRKTTFSSSNDIMPKSFAQEIFQDMLDEEYSKLAAQSGGIGLAEMLYRQMTRTAL
jgi:flagellar protein FlgJ